MQRICAGRRSGKRRGRRRGRRRGPSGEGEGRGRRGEGRGGRGGGAPAAVGGGGRRRYRGDGRRAAEHGAWREAGQRNARGARPPAHSTPLFQGRTVAVIMDAPVVELDHNCRPIATFFDLGLERTKCVQAIALGPFSLTPSLAGLGDCSLHPRPCCLRVGLHGVGLLHVRAAASLLSTSAACRRRSASAIAIALSCSLSPAAALSSAAWRSLACSAAIAACSASSAAYGSAMGSKSCSSTWVDCSASCDAAGEGIAVSRLGPPPRSLPVARSANSSDSRSSALFRSSSYDELACASCEARAD